MGKIIDFEKACQERSIKQKDIKENESVRVRDPKFPNSSVVSLGSVKRERDIFSKMEKLTRTLKDKKTSPDALQENRKIVSAHTQDEMIEWIEKSKESDWDGNPERYKAILEELRNKIRNSVE